MRKQNFRKTVVAVFVFAAVMISITDAPATVEPELCGYVESVTLFAGKTIPAGTVMVGNDDNYLYVTFFSENPWWLGETHLHVADSQAGIPQNKKGNPKIGKFAFQAAHDPFVTEYTYVIPKADISLDLNNAVVMAAHAVVVQGDFAGNITERETGWADGQRFVDKGSWATYFQYTWQECTDTPPTGGSGTETAFAFGGGDATCFLDVDLDQDGNPDFNRWGWTNGPLAPGSYTFDLYAGAEQCDVTNGTRVGDVVVDYDGFTAVVAYIPDPGYTLVETQLYMGSEILPTDANNEFTVAPAQYPDIHDELDNAVIDIHVVNGLTFGNIHVAAHAIVDGF